MNTINDDAVLMGRFIEERSEAAFAELVRRHIDLVYGAAWRRTDGDEALAAEVSLHVFRTFARAARELPRNTVVSAWLHAATRTSAFALMGADQRRRVRDAHALALGPTTITAELVPEWEQLCPLLDEAIDELPKPDCAAVVLRYLERRSWAEIGAGLDLTEDIARVRTERALDKLSAVLGRRGVASTAAALGALLSTQPQFAAPPDLVATVAAEGRRGVRSGSVGAVLGSFMSAKMIVTAAVAAMLGAILGSQVGMRRPIQEPARARPDAEVIRQAQEIASLRDDNRRLHTELATLQAEFARLIEAHEAFIEERGARAPVATASAPVGGAAATQVSRAEVQQAVLNNLRQIAAARDQFHLEYAQPPRSLQDLVGPQGYIRELRSVAGEDYSGVSMMSGQAVTVTTADGMAVTFDPAGGNTTRVELSPEARRAQELEGRIMAPLRRAVEAFRAANGGNDPPNDHALVPYFATPQEGADFVEFLELRAASRDR